MKNATFIVLAILLAMQSIAQNPKKTNATTNMDSTITDEELFAALDNFLDSITAPHSFAMINAGVGSRYFNYTANSATAITNTKKASYAATAGYFHKSGLGVSASAMAVHDGTGVNIFQESITASYDYLKNMALMTGVSYTKYVTKDSLPFYTSPLLNQVNAYFSYRKSWLKPSVSATYGWGNRTQYDQQKKYISLLNVLPSYGSNTTTSQESINDFSVSAAVRHDFTWQHLFSKKDYARLSPQIKFTAGTQKFGLNQTYNSYANAGIMPILYNSKNTAASNKQSFQPLSLTAYLKTEYTIGKFFVQPQLLFDDYLPATKDNFTTAFMLSTGFIF